MVKFFNQLKNRLNRPLLLLILLATVSVGIHQLTKTPFSSWQHHAGDCQNSADTKKIKPPISIPTFFQNWRKCFLTTSASFDKRGLVRGIFLGDDSPIPCDVRELFRNAGLYHLLAASGFNCWIVAFVFGFCAKWFLYFLFPHLPSLISLWLKKWIAPFSQLVGAWLFWLWTDQSPPITRSAIMVSLKFILEWMGLSAYFGRLLFIQYVLSLILFPYLWDSASFQLTFGCLFGILLIPKILEPLKPRVAEKLWGYFSVGVGACIGTIPTTWMVFGEINFTSLLTNWFAIPVVIFGIMPLGLLQILLDLPISPHWMIVCSKALCYVSSMLSEILYQFLKFYLTIVPSLRYHA